jgi:hypothetical protein
VKLVLHIAIEKANNTFSDGWKAIRQNSLGARYFLAM